MITELAELVEFDENSKAKNDMEAFFIEIIIFIFEKLNKAINDKNNILSTASPDQVTVQLVANILINMISTTIGDNLTLEQRRLVVTDLLETIRRVVMDSWERVELIKSKDGNAH